MPVKGRGSKLRWPSLLSYLLLSTPTIELVTLFSPFLLVPLNSLTDANKHVLIVHGPRNLNPINPEHQRPLGTRHSTLDTTNPISDTRTTEPPFLRLESGISCSSYACQPRRQHHSLCYRHTNCSPLPLCADCPSSRNLQPRCRISTSSGNPESS